jgi:hypothetical protein
MKFIVVRVNRVRGLAKARHAHATGIARIVKAHSE